MIENQIPAKIAKLLKNDKLQDKKNMGHTMTTLDTITQIFSHT